MAAPPLSPVRILTAVYNSETKIFPSPTCPVLQTQIYIQVSDNISDEKTFEREHSPLLAIRDAYPKMIIARTHHETYDYQGVQVVDICRWLRE